MRSGAELNPGGVIMPNMSYCRFKNTLGDLYDCVEHMYEDVDDLSDTEAEARVQLIRLCCQVAEDEGYEEP